MCCSSVTVVWQILTHLIFLSFLSLQRCGPKVTQAEGSEERKSHQCYTHHRKNNCPCSNLQPRESQLWSSSWFSPWVLSQWTWTCHKNIHVWPLILKLPHGWDHSFLAQCPSLCFSFSWSPLTLGVTLRLCSHKATKFYSVWSPNRGCFSSIRFYHYLWHQIWFCS